MADGSSNGRRATAARLKTHAARLTRFFRSPLRDRFSTARLSPMVFSWLAGRGASASRLDPHEAPTAAALRVRLQALLADADLFAERIVVVDSEIRTTSPRAPLAQLDRASGYEPGGRRFESCRARDLSSVGFAPPIPRGAPPSSHPPPHALSRAAPHRRSVRVARLLRSFALRSDSILKSVALTQL